MDLFYHTLTANEEYEQYLPSLRVHLTGRHFRQSFSYRYCVQHLSVTKNLQHYSKNMVFIFTNYILKTFSLFLVKGTFMEN